MPNHLNKAFLFFLLALCGGVFYVYGLVWWKVAFFILLGTWIFWIPPKTKWLLKGIFLGYALSLFLSIFVFSFFQLEQNSMAPTFLPNDIILVEKISLGILLPPPCQTKQKIRWVWGEVSKGSVVVFRAPGEKLWLLKRIKKVAGEIITKQDLSSAAFPTKTRKLMAGQKIPPGFVFVQGDNFAHSEDSRHFGLIPISAILGKAIGVLR